MDHDVSISIEKTATLQPALRHQIEACTKEEFANVDIVKQYHWAEPDWTVVIKEGSSLASFLHIIERDVLFDKKSVKVAGISNVVTPPEHRGKGYATDALAEAQRLMFKRLKVDCGLLLCSDDLVPYYEKLGWNPVECSLVFEQPDGKTHSWTARAMFLTPDGSHISPKQINLQGFPW